MLAEHLIRDHRTAKGLPQLGEMPVGFRLPPADDAQDTPYRLPKLSATPDYGDLGGIYSRYGYTHGNPYENLGEKGESSFKWKYPVPTRSFRIYAGPTFRQAVVAPSSTPRLVLPGARVPQVNRLLGRSQTTLSVANNNNNNYARPTPIMRSAAMSSTTRDGQYQVQLQLLQQQQQQQQQHSRLTARQDGQLDADDEAEENGLRWMLNPQRHFQVDRKGQQRNQGPFSREFTVHAMAPPNWLRMKWGRRQQQQQRQLMDGYSRPVAVPVQYYRQYTTMSEKVNRSTDH